MSSPIPYTALNFHQNPRIKPRKIRPPTPAFIKSVLPHQFRATQSIPERGKAVLEFRAGTFADHIPWECVKSGSQAVAFSLVQLLQNSINRRR